MVVLKRFFIFFILLVVVCATLFFSSKINLKNETEIKFSNIQVYTYAEENLQNVSQFKYIKNGEGLIFFCELDSLQILLSKLEYMSGLSFETTESAEAVIRYFNVKNVFTEKIENSNIVNYYGYISNIDQFVSVNNKKVNFHISDISGICKIGIPIIFGSY